MTSLLTAYLLVLLAPLFVASWRLSILGLSLQGLLLAWIVVSRHPALSPSLVVSLIDLAVVRTLVVPLAMYRVVRAQKRPARNDVIPPNMLSWAVSAALVALAFRCASWLEPAAGSQHVLVAVAAAGVLLGLFVLGSQNGTFSQAIGALRIENAIALFELGATEHVPIGLQIGQVVVFVITALVYTVYVDRLYPAAETSRTDIPAL